MKKEKLKKETNLPKLSKKLPIEEYIARQADEEGEDGDVESEEGEGKIFRILRLYRAGYSQKEIVSVGYNRSTVYRQCGEYEKFRKAPAMSMFGLELYEARIQRMMNRKKISRDEAVGILSEKDMED